MAEELREYYKGIEGKDYFEILGVSRSASSEEIRASYLALAKRFHTDKYIRGSEEIRVIAEQLNQRIREAYRVLGNEELRKSYLSGNEGISVARLFEAEGSLNRGYQMLERGDWKAALDIFNSIFELYSEQKHFMVKYYYAKYLSLEVVRGVRDKGAVKSIIESYHKIHESDSSFWEGYYYLGMILKLEGQEKEAYDAFKRGESVSRGKDIRSARELRLKQSRDERQKLDSMDKIGFLSKISEFFSKKFNR